MVFIVDLIDMVVGVCVDIVWIVYIYFVGVILFGSDGRMFGGEV